MRASQQTVALTIEEQIFAVRHFAYTGVLSYGKSVPRAVNSFFNL